MTQKLAASITGNGKTDAGAKCFAQCGATFKTAITTRPRLYPGSAKNAQAAFSTASSTAACRICERFKRYEPRKPIREPLPQRQGDGSYRPRLRRAGLAAARNVSQLLRD